MFISLNGQDPQGTWTLRVIEDLDRIPEIYFKHLEGTDGLYEIRVKVGSDIFRVFCCFDAGRIVILFNGFQKKSQKTPKKEIKKALDLKREYFDKKKGE